MSHHLSIGVKILVNGDTCWVTDYVSQYGIYIVRREVDGHTFCVSVNLEVIPQGGWMPVSATSDAEDIRG